MGRSVAVGESPKGTESDAVRWPSSGGMYLAPQAKQIPKTPLNYWLIAIDGAGRAGGTKAYRRFALGVRFSDF